MPAWLLPVIGAAANAASSIGTNLLSGKSQLKTNQKLMDYQYSKDLAMWDKQNEYNSPTAQMERLKAAGLNPAMVGGNTTTAGNASQMPKYQSPEYKLDVPAPRIDPMEWMLQTQNLKQQSLQNDQLKATTDKIKQETLSAAIQTSLLATNLDQKNINLGISKQTMNYTVSKQIEEANLARLRNENIIKAMKMTDQQIQNMAANHEKIITETQGKKLQNQGFVLDNLNKAADQAFKMYELKLRKMGVNSSDSPLLRMTIQAAANAYGDDWLEKLGNWFTNGKHTYADPSQK